MSDIADNDLESAEVECFLCGVLYTGFGHECNIPFEREWCVMHPSYPDSPHRGPMTEQEAREWVREAVQDDGIREGLFYVACRPVGKWEQA